MQKVEVTGSRIPSLSTEGASPVTVLSAKDIKIDGMRNVEDMLNNLPQVFAGQGAAISNGASGTASVGLRGLGADRTLVLVNGKRMPAGSVSSTAADLNEIPTALIKRVDILTGGAGAVYGAGAVAGVVNFILKDNFEGVEVQLNQTGHNHDQHSTAIANAVAARNYALPGDAKFDGKVKDVNVLIGGNFDGGKGNATAFFTYKEADALTQAQRDFTACSLTSSNTAFSCSGSGTNANGRVNGFTAADAAGNVRAYTAADAYNFGPINYLQRPSQTYGFNAQAHYDINEKVRLYQEFNFHNYSTDAQIAAGGIFYGQQAVLSYDNPLLTQAWKTALGITPTNSVTASVGKRNVEGGPRVDSISDSSYREVLGVKGDLGNWTYDVFGQFARVNHSQHQNGYFSVAKISKALDVITDPATGQPACRSYVNKTDLNCVPYDLYHVGGVTKAALDYLSVSGLVQGYTQQIVYGGSIGSDLSAYGVKSPWSDAGVGVSFGLEHRSEKLVYQPDEENISGDLSGSGGAAPTLTGGYSVKEMYGEFKLPIADKKFLVQSLDLSGSYRHSDYSTGKKTNTYGIGVDWAPIQQARLRASYQRAVRAPTIQDLYNPQSVGNGGPSDDPCAGATPEYSAAECARTGVSASQYGKIEANSANQYHSQTGGNPNVAPEEADTYTFGIVLNPVRDLTLTVDYFKIDINNTISSVDPGIALTQCAKTGNPVFCNLIHRDSLGSLWLTNDGYIQNTTANIGSVGTSGLDFGASYRLRLPANYGVLDFKLDGTLLKSLTVENVPGLGEYDCKGYFGASCGTPNPTWRHKFRTTWTTPWKFDTSLTWRHMNSVLNDALNSSELLSGTVNQIESRLGARDYIDLNVNYQLNKKISLSAGVNNLFDRDPPIASTNATAAAGSANGNTYPQVYDSTGRYIYLNLTARF
ncbi:TonB-dependent receptor domain-containing protein [Oxalobacteraceae bacterium A2-2]